MDKPFTAVGTIGARGDGGEVCSIHVGEASFMPKLDTVYDVSITEHLPSEITEVAMRNEAASGNHYKIHHPDGRPLDPAAVTFVLRPDTDEAARAALDFYIAEWRRLDVARRLDVVTQEYELLKSQLSEAQAVIADYQRQGG